MSEKGVNFWSSQVTSFATGKAIKKLPNPKDINSTFSFGNSSLFQNLEIARRPAGVRIILRHWQRRSRLNVSHSTHIMNMPLCDTLKYFNSDFVWFYRRIWPNNIQSASIFVLHTNCWNIIMSKIPIKMIRIYQRYAPARLRRTCRYNPSCSEYAIASLQKYGFFRGIWKSMKRIIRCRPPYGGDDQP